MFTSPWLLLAVGCAPELPAPTLEAVAPTWGWNGESTDVTVVGTNLLPSIFAYADTRGDHRIYDDFQVELVGDGGLVIPLSGEDLESYKALGAQVPAGHPVGVYDVRLTGPEGDQSLLVDGFTITATRADHLEFVVEEVAYEVGETAYFGLLLTDPGGFPVGEDIAIEVRADPDQGADFVVLDATGLENPESLTDGVGISGRLGADGEATLFVEVKAPGGVRLRLDPQDEDSLIRGDELFFEFSSGPVTEVLIDLLGDGEDFTAVAGEPFPVNIHVLDGLGIPVDVPTDLVIEEVCGTYRESVTVLDGFEEDFFVEVTQTTDGDCTANQLLVSGGGTGESAEFQVNAGGITELRVLPAESEAVAGVPFPVFVWAVDKHENTVHDFPYPVNLSVDPGSLVSGDCEDGTIRYCTLLIEEAGDATIVLANIDAPPAGGQSDPIQVAPSLPFAIEVTQHEVSLVAGSPTDVTLSVTDAFGNGAVIDPTGADAFSADDGSEAADCTWLDEPDPGVHVLSCSVYTAGSQLPLTFRVDSLSLVALAVDVDVVNGDLARVAGTASPATVAAGEDFTLDVIGTDTWGNAYTTQTVATVDISDPAQSVVPTTLELDSAGLGTELGPFTVDVAGDPVILSFSQAGTVLGDLSLTVTAADVSQLDVAFDAPWTWLDDDLPVVVTAQDVFGNTVTDFSSPVVLTSAGSGFLSTPLAGFSSGVASTTLSWDAALLQDIVTATSDPSVVGSSAPLDVLDDSCTSGPSAVLDLDSKSEAVACRVGGVASVTADFSGSFATAGLVAYHLDDGQGTSTRLGTTSTTVSSANEGWFQVGLVAVDVDACGAETSASWWIGDADGEPVGPVTLSSSHTERTAGSSTNGIATVGVEATTCSGDLAAGGTLLARADLGELTGLTSTGSGLALTLDGSGAGSLSWSLETENHAGTAGLHVGTADGASYGSVALDVTGDSARPTLVDVDPSGATSELLDSVMVTFSEPMDSSTLTALTVVLEGPDGTEAWSSLDLDETGTVLTAMLDEIVDAAAGSWSFEVSFGARDEGGDNRLDGTWSGGSADFESVFGDVADEGLSVDSCVLDSASFSPDGDPGSGVEADSVSVTVEASGEPAWWELQVVSEQGSPVLTTRTAGSGTASVLTWTGTGDDGFVVTEGVYTVMISTFDSSDNQSTSCESEVTLVLHIGDPT